MDSQGTAGHAQNPVSLGYCTVDGHRLCYRQAGQGEPVLLIHGITTYSFIWQQLWPILATGYRVISVDLLGCGDSDKPLATDYSLLAQTRLLAEFVSNLGLGKVHFVGHDVGGGIAQLFAVNYPQLVRDVAVVNSVGHDFWPVQPIIAMRTPIVRQLAMATLDMGAFRLLIRRGLYHHERLTKELMAQFWHPMRDKAGRRSFLHFANCLNNRHLVEIESQLKSLTLPVLIVRGEHDLYLSEAISQKLHRDISGSTLLRLPTAGHYLQLDEPRQLADGLQDFWAGQR